MSWQALTGHYPLLWFFWIPNRCQHFGSVVLTQQTTFPWSSCLQLKKLVWRKWEVNGPYLTQHFFTKCSGRLSMKDLCLWQKWCSFRLSASETCTNKHYSPAVLPLSTPGCPIGNVLKINIMYSKTLAKILFNDNQHQPDNNTSLYQQILDAKSQNHQGWIQFIFIKKILLLFFA